MKYPITRGGAMRMINAKHRDVFLTSARGLNEGNDGVWDFKKMSRDECRSIVESGKTLVRIHDGFADQIRVFSSAHVHTIMI